MPQKPVMVAIVDRNAMDYDDLLSVPECSDLNVCFLSHGNDALHLARSCTVNLWLINATLSDMSGFDLAKMVRRLSPGARIFIVSDDYNMDDELRTLSLGMTKYLCKPVEASWIFSWIHHVRGAKKPIFAFSSPVAQASPDAAVLFPLLDDIGDVADRKDPVLLPFVHRQPHRRPAA
jgi:DNA-binding response OmpR family regulator